MAINIKLDLVGNPEPPTIILANRNGNKLGQLKVNNDSIELADKLDDASEISFTINKYINEEITPLWDKVVDFKLIYCKEWDTWFEISVELDEEEDTVKTVFCTQLGQAELSQIMLYDIEINTEKDIERDDYKISILYDENDPKASTLDRMLEKAPHYSVAYVDPTIAKIQRSFSFNGTSIHDGFKDIEEEIGCIFKYPSNSNADGKINRKIYVYDLQQNCNNCGHRGEFTDKCPECGSTNIKYGYGEDTLIFVTSDELASGGIQLVTDVDSVKNCFKLEAGDDLMTATIRSCNPNGTDYIWYFSDGLKEDMTEELAEKLDSYNRVYKQYYNEYVSDIDVKLLNNYNTLINKYSVYNKELQPIKTPIEGYSALMNAYYNVIDLLLFLESGLMPSIEMSETNATEQASLLTTSSLSPVAVTDINIVSLATANNAVLAMAKIIIKPTYKVEIKKDSSQLYTNGSKKYWKGKFIVTNYSDEEDVAESNEISVELNDDLETVTKQKIEKLLNKENTDDLSITGLFEMEYGDFCAELKKYALKPLVGFRDTCQSCIDILIEQGIGNNSTWSDNESGSEGNLYENLYIPYYNKLKAIESEIKIREDEINIISGVYDEQGNIIIKGLKDNIEECKILIQDALNFENYLGNDLWLEFCAYRRDDKYSNENYISDGLNNAQLFEKALEFFKVAENEIYKSAELQHSISTTLNNLLAIKKFKDLVKYFNVGNWIRVQIDNRIFKLRLLKYEINFGDFNNIPVDFSDVVKIKNGTTDVQSVLSQASSMATSYSSVQRQASQGAKSNSVLNNWVESGLSATQTKIIDSQDENLMFGKSSFWCRQYDPITDTYSDEQIKIVNSTIAITDDNWATTKTAIGKYYYVDPITKELKSAYGVNGETIVGKLFVGENLLISNDKGNLEFNNEGFVVTGDANTVVINPNNTSVFTIKNSDGDYILYVNNEGNLVVTGDIVATSLKMEDGSVIEGIKVDNVAGLHNIAISGSYNDLEDKPNLSAVALSGSYNDLKNKPSLSTVATSGSYNDLQNKPNLSEVATSGSYNDLEDKPTKLSNFENDGMFITKDVSDLTNYYKKLDVDNLLKTKVDTKNLSAVALSGSYDDLLNSPKNISAFNNDVGYLVNEDLDDAINDALEIAKNSGEFDGEDGVSVSHLWNDTVLTITSASGTSSSDLKGEKGDSPVRGTDYWTDDDKAEIVNAVLEELRNQGIIN